MQLRIRFQLLFNYSKGAPHLAQNDPTISWDLQLRMRTFKLTIEDDPFEIKLAYNYALMHDEHLESAKRRKQLEQRRLIKEQHLEREALEILSEREAVIYMQRSRQIYRQSRVRKELFSWSVLDLGLYALCDSEWHGRAKCYEMLRRIDSESAEPVSARPDQSPAERYHILWCRYLNVNAAEIVLGMCFLSVL